MEQYSTDQIWVALNVHQSNITAATLHGDSHDPEVVRLTSNLNVDVFHTFCDCYAIEVTREWDHPDG